MIKINAKCKECKHWDLYCTLGKDEYYWCKIYNWNRFELKKDLKEIILKKRHKKLLSQVTKK